MSFKSANAKYLFIFAKWRLYMSQQSIDVKGRSYQRQYRRRLISYYNEFARQAELSSANSWPSDAIEREIWKTILSQEKGREQHIASLVGQLILSDAA
jgi:hypothetical protein